MAEYKNELIYAFTVVLGVLPPHLAGNDNDNEILRSIT
jgi:hypothetical protein